MIETATYLDDLPPNGDLRQARVNALPALPVPTLLIWMFFRAVAVHEWGT